MNTLKQLLSEFNTDRERVETELQNHIRTELLALKARHTDLMQDAGSDLTYRASAETHVEIITDSFREITLLPFVVTSKIDVTFKI